MVIVDAKIKLLQRKGLNPKYWCTVDNLAPFFNVSHNFLSKLFKTERIPSHPIQCLNYYYTFYFRPAAIKSIQDLRKRSRTRKPCKIPIKRFFCNKSRYISLNDAAALYNISIAAVDYRIFQYPHPVYCFLHAKKSANGNPVVTKYYDKAQLENAMQYFLAHRYSPTGRVRLAKRDKYARKKSDVQSWRGKGSKKRALLEHLGLNSGDFMDD